MKIDMNELIHLPNKSVYNNNYYKGKDANTDVEIFIHCDEQYSTYSFYVCLGDLKIFIGSSQNFKCEDLHDVSFGEIYT